ncbi:unnamed protein product, partial [Mesorhabditis belari]
LLLLWLTITIHSFPVYEDLTLSELNAASSTETITHPHHRHRKHHRHHKKRRSLSSKEGEANRNKRIIQIKPYWPWP